MRVVAARCIDSDRLERATTLTRGDVHRPLLSGDIGAFDRELVGDRVGVSESARWSPGIERNAVASETRTDLTLGRCRPRASRN